MANPFQPIYADSIIRLLEDMDSLGAVEKVIAAAIQRKIKLVNAARKNNVDPVSGADVPHVLFGDQSRKSTTESTREKIIKLAAQTGAGAATPSEHDQAMELLGLFVPLEGEWDNVDSNLVALILGYYRQCRAAIAGCNSAA